MITIEEIFRRFSVADWVRTLLEVNNWRDQNVWFGFFRIKFKRMDYEVWTLLWIPVLWTSTEFIRDNWNHSLINTNTGQPGANGIARKTHNLKLFFVHKKLFKQLDCRAFSVCNFTLKVLKTIMINLNVISCFLFNQKPLFYGSHLLTIILLTNRRMF